MSKELPVARFFFRHGRSGCSVVDLPFSIIIIRCCFRRWSFDVRFDTSSVTKPWLFSLCGLEADSRAVICDVVRLTRTCLLPFKAVDLCLLLFTALHAHRDMRCWRKCWLRRMIGSVHCSHIAAASIFVGLIPKSEGLFARILPVPCIAVFVSSKNACDRFGDESVIHSYRSSGPEFRGLLLSTTVASRGNMICSVPWFASGHMSKSSEPSSFLPTSGVVIVAIAVVAMERTFPQTGVHTIDT